MPTYRILDAYLHYPKRLLFIFLIPTFNILNVYLLYLQYFTKYIIGQPH